MSEKIDPRELTEFMRSKGVVAFEYGDLKVTFHHQAVELPEVELDGKTLAQQALERIKKEEKEQRIDEEWSV